MPTLQDLYAFLNQSPSGQRIGQALANASRPAVPVPSGDDPRLEQARSLSAGLAQGLLGMGGSRPSVMDDPSGSYDLGEGAGLLGNAIPLAKALAAPAAAMGLLSAVAKARGVTTTPSRLARALKNQEGMIAYHGSPHSFDKFSLDKIGTGEGAQAYGHGLYLAESPAVAEDYRTGLTQLKGKNPTINGEDIHSMANRVSIDGNDNRGDTLRDFYQFLNEPNIRPAVAKGEISNADAIKLFKERTAQEADQAGAKYADFYNARQSDIDWLNKNLDPLHSGSLYKTDIPDEAVSRFLDWDKTLSQQAPEVQAAINNTQWMPASEPNIGGMTGEQLINALSRRDGSKLFIGDRGFTSDYLHKQGIPGIRYLDGGSRGAGSGTSNFVVFDPEMIRILERNGQATGAQPWQPGEWKGLLGK